jgi:hypothetical protein
LLMSRAEYLIDDSLFVFRKQRVGDFQPLGVCPVLKVHKYWKVYYSHDKRGR